MTARLTYSGNNIDLLVDKKGLITTQDQKMKRNIAGPGVIEQINFHGIEAVEFSAVFTAAVERQLYTWWWGWARYGRVFSFALDSTNTVSTTLDGSTSGATIPLTATTGLSVGDECIVIAAGDNAREKIIIDSISAGVSVTADASLINSFASGDRFIHADYFPVLQSMDKNFKPKKKGQYYSIKFKWMEVVDYDATAVLDDGESAILI